MSKEMQDLFYELKQYLVQHSSKWNTLCDIEQYVLNLQQENEELKDTILNYQLHTEVAPNSHENINGNELICNLFTENKNIKKILTEFEKWLEEDFKNEVEHPTPQIYCNCYSCKIKVLDKLQELKEGKNIEKTKN